MMTEHKNELKDLFQSKLYDDETTIQSVRDSENLLKTKALKTSK
jgi:hypothetical protein